MELMGLDLHTRESQRSIKADDGTITDRRIATSRERFAAVFGERPRARIPTVDDITRFRTAHEAAHRSCHHVPFTEALGGRQRLDAALTANLPGGPRQYGRARTATCPPTPRLPLATGLATVAM